MPPPAPRCGRTPDRAPPARQILGDGTIRDVVRRLCPRGCIKRYAGTSSRPATDEQVAILHAGVKLEAHRVATRGLHGLDEWPAFLAGDVSGGEVAHFLVLDRDEVAADGPVTGAQGNAHCGGLQGRAAGVDLKR